MDSNLDMTTMGPAPGSATARLEQRLDRLSERIRDLNRDVGVSLGMALSQAMDCGDALHDAKRNVPHGEWLPYLETCEVARREPPQHRRANATRCVAFEHSQRSAADREAVVRVRIIVEGEPQAERPVLETDPDVAAFEAKRREHTTINGEAPSTGGTTISDTTPPTAAEPLEDDPEPETERADNDVEMKIAMDAWECLVEAFNKIAPEQQSEVIETMRKTMPLTMKAELEDCTLRLAASKAKGSSVKNKINSIRRRLKDETQRAATRETSTHTI